jgi:hypothetical protein
LAPDLWEDDEVEEEEDLEDEEDLEEDLEDFLAGAESPPTGGGELGRLEVAPTYIQIHTTMSKNGGKDRKKQNRKEKNDQEHFLRIFLFLK